MMALTEECLIIPLTLTNVQCIDPTIPGPRLGADLDHVVAHRSRKDDVRQEPRVVPGAQTHLKYMHNISLQSEINLGKVSKKKYIKGRDFSLSGGGSTPFPIFFFVFF